MFFLLTYMRSRIRQRVIYYIKSVAELRNVGDAAYAMSHAAAVAGCRVWHGYRITAYRLAACEC